MSSISIDHSSPTAPVNVVVEWGAAYELVEAIAAFAQSPLRADLDIGPHMEREAARLVPEETRNEIAAIGPRFCEVASGWLTSLIHRFPARDSAPAFIDWLAGASLGTLYEQLIPTLPADGKMIPRDFAETRDRWVRWMRLWHDGYFREIEPRLRDDLERSAREVAARRDRMDPLDLVEEVTGGLRVEPTRDLTIVLVPQSHLSPYNDVTIEHDRTIMMYPVEPRFASGAPRRLTRIARALADDSRLRILRLIAARPLSLAVLTRAIGLSQGTVSHHVLTLRAAGLVRTHLRDGIAREYSLHANAIDAFAPRLHEYLATNPEDDLTPGGPPVSDRKKRGRKGARGG